jgi:hypothetical protein
MNQSNFLNHPQNTYGGHPLLHPNYLFNSVLLPLPQPDIFALGRRPAVMGRLGRWGASARSGSTSISNNIYKYLGERPVVLIQQIHTGYICCAVQKTPPPYPTAFVTITNDGTGGHYPVHGSPLPFSNTLY